MFCYNLKQHVFVTNSFDKDTKLEENSCTENATVTIVSGTVCERRHNNYTVITAPIRRNQGYLVDPTFMLQF